MLSCSWNARCKKDSWYLPPARRSGVNWLTGAGLRLSAGSDPMKVSQGDVSIVLEPKTNPLFIGIHHSIIE
jgi:hypothetical protein